MTTFKKFEVGKVYSISRGGLTLLPIGTEYVYMNGLNKHDSVSRSHDMSGGSDVKIRITGLPDTYAHGDDTITVREVPDVVPIGQAKREANALYFVRVHSDTRYYDFWVDRTGTAHGKSFFCDGAEAQWSGSGADSVSRQYSFAERLFGHYVEPGSEVDKFVAALTIAKLKEA